MAAGTFSRRITMVVRILLGLGFLAIGIMGLFIHPKPKEMPPPEQMAIVEGLAKGGYITVVSATELIVGVLLLLNVFVPLALALITPIIVGMITFHLAAAPSSIVPSLVLLLLVLFLAFAYRYAFYPMLAFRPTPGPK